MKSFLEAKDILEPNDVRRPKVLVELLPVPAAEFGGEVVDVVKLMIEKDALDLPVMRDIALVIIRSLEQSAVGHDQRMATTFQRLNQSRADSASCT